MENPHRSAATISSTKAKMKGSQAFDLLIEDAGAEGCFGHIPALPGLCFRGESPEVVEELAAARIADYARWLSTNGLNDLTPETSFLIECLGGEAEGELRAVVAEHVNGAPVWESGNAAVLFEHDLVPLEDAAVDAHLRFVRRVLDRVHASVADLNAEERNRRPSPGRRSIDETLEHIGNCIWWYCSRIDNALPEPKEPAGEQQIDRIDRLFAVAGPYLRDVAISERSTICVPTRFPTEDPQERWTHTKVCRRQAEHVWAHLPGVRRAAHALRAEGEDVPR